MRFASFVLFVLLLCVAMPLLPAAESAADGGLQFFERRVKADPDDFIAWNQLGDRCLSRILETGDDTWLTRAAESANASLQAMPQEQNPTGLALRARVALASHQFAAARDHAGQLRKMQPGKSEAIGILADALLELGDLDEAAVLIEELAQHDRERVNLEPRRARLALARGERDEARAHFTAARDAAIALDPPVPLLLAWCEVELGEFAFRSGDWTAAETHYEAARTALPGWWLALEHLAELRAAQGRDAEAFALYEQVIAKVPRPELLQAVGDLYVFTGQKEQAKTWFDRARGAYLRSIDAGSVRYLHHLAGFYCDSEDNPSEALKWAREDLKLRQSAQAFAALAWALYKSGDTPAADEAITKALASGSRDAHVLQHAALIRMSSGDVQSGQALLREAGTVNPHFRAFHVHR